MAKSMRSKWRRKCRAVKRVRYGEKERQRLKKILGIDESQPKDATMSEVNEIANVVDSIPKKEGDEMDLDQVTKKFNHKTLRDKNGAYPIWLHPRKVVRKKKKDKKSKSKGKQTRN